VFKSQEEQDVPPSPFPRLKPRDMKLTTHLYVILILRRFGTIFPVPNNLHTVKFDATQGQLHLLL
jgi:hypothetical protein